MRQLVFFSETISEGLIIYFLAQGLQVQKLYQDKRHKLTLGLKVLGLGKTLYLWGCILDSRVRTANQTQDATSAKPKPGVFAT